MRHVKIVEFGNPPLQNDLEIRFGKGGICKKQRCVLRHELEISKELKDSLIHGAISRHLMWLGFINKESREKTIPEIIRIIKKALHSEIKITFSKESPDLKEIVLS